MMEQTLAKQAARQILRQTLHAIPMHGQRLLPISGVVQQLNRQRSWKLWIFLLAQSRQVHARASRPVLADRNQQERQTLGPLPARLPPKIKISDDRIEQARSLLGKRHAIHLVGLATVQQAKERVRIVRITPEQLRPSRHIHLAEHVVRRAHVKRLRQQRWCADDATRRRRGVPFRLRRGVGTRNFPAIEIRHETVVAAHLQPQGLQRRIRQIKRHPHVGRRSLVQHPALQVRSFRGGLVASISKPHASRDGQPFGIVKLRRRPAHADVGGRNKHPLRRRRSEDHRRPVGHLDAIRRARDLRRILGSKLRRNRGPVRFDERKIAAVRVELEVRVKLRPRDTAILLGSEHHQILTRCHRRGGETPLLQLRAVIGEKPPVKIRRRRARVAQLNPVGMLTVTIGKRANVRRHELRDDNTVLCDGSQRPAANGESRHEQGVN